MKRLTSPELFALFDQLYLLSDGVTVYHGKGSESVEYFASLGYPCPTFLNPSDYFMRQLVVMDKATDDAGVARVEGLKQAWATRLQEMAESEVSGVLYSRFQSDLSDDDDEYEGSWLHWLGQVGVLVTRNVTRILRDKVGFGAALFQALFMSLIVSLTYLQLNLRQTGIQNFVDAMFFIVVSLTFTTANPMFTTVPLELPVVFREYETGLYHLVSWYISKNLSELPMQIFLPIVAFAPVYLLVGIGHGFDVYFYMQLVVILVYSAAIGLGYMVSCLCRRVDIAPIIGVVIILPFLLFGGLLINSDDCPDYFVWIQYISPIKYGFEALMKIYWDQVGSILCTNMVENCIARNAAKFWAISAWSTANHSATR